MPLVWFCWPPNSQSTVFCKNYFTSKALRLTYQLWLNHAGRRRCVSNTRLLSSQLDDVGYFAAYHYWKCLVVHLSLSVYNKWGETCTFFSRIKMLSSRRNKLTNMFFCKQYFDPGTIDIFFRVSDSLFRATKRDDETFSVIGVLCTTQDDLAEKITRVHSSQNQITTTVVAVVKGVELHISVLWCRAANGCGFNHYR